MDPVIGYRHWWLIGGPAFGRPYALVSPVQHKPRFEWAPGRNTARCGDGGPAADAGCSCGIYAAHSPAVLRPSVGHEWTNLVTGLVVGWGRVVVHPEGWRAQHARVVGLAEHRSEATTAALREVAGDFGVPLVPPDFLPLLAAEFGASAA